MTEIFERAAREKTRFPSSKGNLNVEDLWDLSVRELDKIFQSLNAELKSKKEAESLLTELPRENTELELKVAIIRHIVGVKLADADAAEQEIARKEKKEKIREILAGKQNASLASLSEEELVKMLDDL